MRKILCFILSLVMILTVSVTFGESAAGLTKDVKILFTSDVHCGIDQGWGYSGIYAVRENLARDYHMLLVDDGDAIQGEPVGLLTKGKAILRIMNTTGYDIAIPGNHEFDFGMENFLTLAGEAEFQYISCNFNHEGALVFPPYVIREFDGVKIGFVGVTTPMTIRDSAPKYFMDENGNYVYGFFQDESGEKLAEAVQRAVDSARAEGCEYVIALAHLGNEEEVSPWMYSDLISRTTGIDAWLDGHSHDTDHVEMKDKSGRVVVRQACGTKNANIGLLTIATNGKITAELLPWSASVSAPKLLGFSNPAAGSRMLTESKKPEAACGAASFPLGRYVPAAE